MSTQSSPPASSLPGGASVADYFKGAPARYRHMGTPFYAALAERCAVDPEILELAANAGNGQPPTHLLMGAVQYLLLRQKDAELARYYASLTPDPAPAAAAFEPFRAFCRENRTALVDILRTRTVQTTIVGRAGHLLPAMAHAARQADGEPLTLIEVGCSAGLLTLFDHYRYDFGTLGQVGPVDGPPVTSCRFDPAPPLPIIMPRIANRIGVDLNPIDATDPEERRWIEALLPPDWQAERAQIRTALDYRARTPFPIQRGDAMQVVPALLKDSRGPVCVLHSHCLYQWPADAQAAFEAMLSEASRGRVLHRVGVELLPEEQSGRSWRAEAARTGNVEFDVFHIEYRDGAQRFTLLASADGWGRQARWLAAN